MRRLVLALVATVVLTVGASLTVVGLGDSEVTINCDDGSSVTVVVDPQTLLGITEAVQAMLDYPSGMTCSLTQNLVAAPILGLKALADAPKDMALQGSQWGTPGFCVVNLSFNGWKDVSGRFRGTVNQSVPAGQTCFSGMGGHFTATIDTCFSVGRSTLGNNEGVLVGHVTHASGIYTPFIDSPYYAYAEDVGNPHGGISPDMFWSDFNTTAVTTPDCRVHPYLGQKDRLLNGNNVVKDSLEVGP